MSVIDYEVLYENSLPVFRAQYETEEDARLVEETLEQVVKELYGENNLELSRTGNEIRTSREEDRELLKEAEIVFGESFFTVREYLAEAITDEMENQPESPEMVSEAV